MLDMPTRSPSVDLRTLLRAPAGTIARALSPRFDEPVTVAICDVDGVRQIMQQHSVQPMSSWALAQCFEDEHGRNLLPVRLVSPEVRPLTPELAIGGSRSSRERSWEAAQAALDALPRGVIIDASTPSPRALWGLVVATKVDDSRWLLVDDLGASCEAAGAWLDDGDANPESALAEEDLIRFQGARFEVLAASHEFRQTP